MRATLESLLAVLAQYLAPAVVRRVLRNAWLHILTVGERAMGGIGRERKAEHVRAMLEQIFYDIVNGDSAETAAFRQPHRAANASQYLHVRAARTGPSGWDEVLTMG